MLLQAFNPRIWEAVASRSLNGLQCEFQDTSQGCIRQTNKTNPLLSQSLPDVSSFAAMVQYSGLLFSRRGGLSWFCSSLGIVWHCYSILSWDSSLDGVVNLGFMLLIFFSF